MREQKPYWVSSLFSQQKEQRLRDAKLQLARLCLMSDLFDLMFFIHPGIGHRSFNQSVMLLIQTYVNCVSFMQFHRGEICLLWKNSETVPWWHVSHCPRPSVCAHHHPTFHRPGRSHPQRPLTGRRWRASRDEPTGTHWTTHDLGASSPWKEKNPTLRNTLFKMSFVL